MSGTTEPTVAEQHLGDRLAGLIDGELGHEARERVLAHLATCHGCKAEADAQRRVKNVFAAAAPPPPSDGFLARLQGLPAAGGPDDGGPGHPGGHPGGLPPLELTYLPTAAPGGGMHPQRGFRIHRSVENERAASRGRRFAFAAAGAFSLAAVAIGGALGTAAPGGSATSQAGSPATTLPRTLPAGPAERAADRRGDSLVPVRAARTSMPPAAPRTRLLRSPDGLAFGPVAASFRTPTPSAGLLSPPPLSRAAHPVVYDMRPTPEPAAAPGPSPAGGNSPLRVSP
ncbi:zf-HC2 domain-containing protein [Streptomyces sp. 549]|uniref:zf-HC2 domain-containing protein n=1 Tax=Streptomyces sp. 549 TaxID=3049076 RepID=UPI0024C3CDAE|nr:zf-HC2 domain-containing protein [Streptomyces sp. 549]MDK1476264.1 zf-HC2 domain-containing protein [Streptomyces sp. 549]